MNATKIFNSLSQKIPVWAVYLMLALPPFYLTYALFTNQLGPDPIRTYERSIGE